MPLNFHLSTKEKDASFSDSRASLDFKTHKDIFSLKDLTEEKFPVFYKMNHYFTDAKYETDEFSVLVEEIEAIKEMAVSNRRLEELLDTIIDLVEEADKASLSLFVFCD